MNENYPGNHPEYFLSARWGADRRDGRKAAYVGRRKPEPLLCSACSHQPVRIQGSSEETLTIITVMNALGPFAAILYRVTNTVNN